MPSAWVTHVQGVYKKGKAKGMTYSQAMQKAKVSWAKKKKSNASTAPAAKKKAGKKKAKAEDDDDVEDEKAAEKPKRRKRAKKKVKTQEEVAEEPVRSRKGKGSAGNRRTKAKYAMPRGIPGVGAPHKE